MIVKRFLVHLIIIKSEVRVITYCLGLDALHVFLCSFNLPSPYASLLAS